MRSLSLATGLVLGLASCADYDGGTLHRLEFSPDGWPTVVEVEPDQSMRFRLDVPMGARGLLIYTESANGTLAGVGELIDPEGRRLVEQGLFTLGDGDQGPARSTAAALPIPNYGLQGLDAGVWRVGVGAATEHVEIWASADVGSVTRFVDVVTHMEQPLLGDVELEGLFEEALGLLGLSLGSLERRRTVERLRIDASQADADIGSIPFESNGVLNVIFYSEIDGVKGASSIGGVPRGGSIVGGLVIERNAGPEVLAHEIGHFLGLLHTADADGNDLLESTPPCEPEVFDQDPQECPGYDNLMTPASPSVFLTDEQRVVINSSVLWHP